MFRIVLVVLAALAACASPRQEVITEENLLEHEQHWPYRVQLVRPFERSQGRRPVSAGRVGVLIRVERSGDPRIDFGRLGKYEVPIDMTDVVARANRIRTGELEKARPNFTHAIRTRMLSAAHESPMPLPVEETDARTEFLCVFADPSDAGFADLVHELASLKTPAGLQTILFPQGRHRDVDVHARLGELAWRVPFLPDFLSEPYTRTILRDPTRAPFVLLQTNEGRLLYEGAWGPDVTPTLEKLLEASSGGRPARRAPGTVGRAARS